MVANTFVLKGRRLTAGVAASVYGADGRLMARLQKGQSIRLKRGLYFVKTAKGTTKVLVR